MESLLRNLSVRFRSQVVASEGEDVLMMMGIVQRRKSRTNEL